MQRIWIPCISLAMAATVSGPTKEEKMKNKIKSMTEWNIAYKDGNPEPCKPASEESDRKGRSALRTEYGHGGAVPAGVTAGYDSYDHKTGETEYEYY